MSGDVNSFSHQLMRLRHRLKTICFVMRAETRLREVETRRAMWSGIVCVFATTSASGLLEIKQTCNALHRTAPQIWVDKFISRECVDLR